jgi:N-acetylglutamate synthase-like GNAT family acetyltransferase
MSIAIRDAVLLDVPEIEGVFRRASLSNENDRDLLLRHPELLNLSEAGIRESRMRVAVDEDNSVVGFATYLIVDGVAELEDLFVDPAQMRRRIGEALVLDISIRVRHLGFETLEVTANPHATAFYKHMGFEHSHIVKTEGYPASRMQRPTH